MINLFSSDITKQTVYHFTCKGCNKTRQSVSKEIARLKKCSLCRKTADTPTNQTSLFDNPEVSNGQN